MSKNKAIFVFGLLSVFSLILSYLMIAKTRSLPSESSKRAVRQAVIAGSFYPNDSEELSSQLQAFLDLNQALTKEGKLKILIVPHAGIQYSGEVAAAGFKQIEDKSYSRVILLGASHRVAFNSVAIYPEGSWETPLGETKVDKNLANKLIDNEQKIYGNTAPHQEEHSLEVELIFLQKILKNFEIVPILIGQPDQEVLTQLAKKISQNLDEETLLVVSTDLSHFQPYEIANKTDRQTINAILTQDPEEFQNIPDLIARACGHQPVLVALKVASLLESLDFEEIKYANSGDSSGDKSQVVGYVAIGAWEKEDSFKKEALAIARDTLEKHLSGLPLSPLSPQASKLFQKLGAFVTLRKKGELRGCIGEFEPNKPLYEVIQEMAIAAAENDPRFPPVSQDELKDIKIEISVMTPRRKIDSWKEIELGKHGVVVQYGNQGGTFLPQVAEETGWSLEEFLSQLCTQKARLPAHCYKSPQVNLYVFEVEILEER
jgi:AmmeMemoRadiSam system protein B/AmmeMemoRadiSam system protein A